MPNNKQNKPVNCEKFKGDSNNELKRKTLVLDLDETLVHSKYTEYGTRYPERKYKTNKIENNPDFVFSVSINFKFNVLFVTSKSSKKSFTLNFY